MKKWIACAALLGAITVAHADIIVLVGPGNLPDDENVLYNTGSLLDNGSVVQGITNRTDTIIDIYGAGEDLVTPSLGQARVEAVDGALTSLSISPNDPALAFYTLILNINAAADGTVTFSADGFNLGTFDLDAQGENFFRFLTTEGDSFDVLSFTSTVDIQDVKQIRVGIVPEPASMAALGLGFLGLLRRRSQRR